MLCSILQSFVVVAFCITDDMSRVDIATRATVFTQRYNHPKHMLHNRWKREGTTKNGKGMEERKKGKERKRN